MPEVHASGGPEAMGVAHRLFHADGHGILAYLRDQPEGRHRREISLMLCSIMMRAARQDLFEQGDVWARVADYRKTPPGSNPDRPGPLDHVRRLITADAESHMRDGVPRAHCAPWAGRLHDRRPGTRQPHRGRATAPGPARCAGAPRDLRLERLGLPYTTQSVLAGMAKTAVFGPDPANAKAGSAQP